MLTRMFFFGRKSKNLVSRRQIEGDTFPGWGWGKPSMNTKRPTMRVKQQKSTLCLKKVQQKLEEQEDQLKEIMESWQRGMDVVMNVIETQNAMAQNAMQV